MSAHLIDVEAVTGGWRVVSDLCETPLMFPSGAVAEAQARNLAAAAQARGGETEIRVRDGSGGLIAHFAAPALVHPDLPRRRRRFSAAELASD